MKIAVGSDHAGFPLKQVVIDAAEALGHKVIDVGTEYASVSVDYPDFAYKVGKQVLDGNAERGIAICGSGVGACIASNKMKGIYAALCHDTYSAHQGVEHDGMNVLCLGARIIGTELATEIVQSFLQAETEQAERHQKRRQKIKDIESGQYKER